MEIVRHHINVVHILIDLGHVVRKVDDSLGRRSGQTEQIGATLALIFASDFVQQLGQMLTLAIGRRGKLPVQVHAVQVELLERLLQRPNELHAIGVIRDHLLETGRLGAAHPDEHFQPRVGRLQGVHLLQGSADRFVEQQFVVPDPDHADVDVRTQMRIDVGRDECGRRGRQIVADQFRAFGVVGFVDEIAESRWFDEFVFKVLENIIDVVVVLDFGGLSIGRRRLSAVVVMAKSS